MNTNDIELSEGGVWGPPIFTDDEDIFSFSDIIPEDTIASVVEDNDSIPTERQYEIIKARKSYEKVDNQIIKFTENFVESQEKLLRQKHSLKYVFFIITMLAFLIVIISPILVVVFMNSKDTIAYVAGIVAALIQSMASIITLPKIVAQYLFNKEEDVSTIEIIKLIQEFSDKAHDYDKENT